MGAVHFSINCELASVLQESASVKTFIETGTFKGDSIASVRSLFEELHTGELSPELYRAAEIRFETDPSIHCHLGSSPDILKELAKKVRDKPVMYWLDAHWCSAENVAGGESQCPLLQELEAIKPIHQDSIVWIDDARYFMSPPTAPLVSKGWPTFQQVLDKLSALSDVHNIVFADDTILLFPKHSESVVMDYLHKHGINWLEAMHHHKKHLKRSKRNSRKKTWVSLLKKNIFSKKKAGES